LRPRWGPTSVVPMSNIDQRYGPSGAALTGSGVTRISAVTIGVYVHAEPGQLRETLAALDARTAAGFELRLLPDGPDAGTRAALAGLAGIAQSASETPLAAAGCFNRLARETATETLVPLESGTIVAPDWLEKLLAADLWHGLACPSINRIWNQLPAFLGGRGDYSDHAHCDLRGTARRSRRASDHGKGGDNHGKP
jgi:hypothetical protein